MNSLKSHISLIIALVSILFSVFLYIVFSKMLTKYQASITSNYSITIVSTKKIDHLNISDIKEIKPIDTSSYKKNLKKNFPNIDFNTIKFPYFYSLTLKTLPNPKKLSEIEKTLLNKPFIKRVLTYRSNQTKIYNLLFLLRITSNVFVIIISVLGFLLIVKQLEVWKFEHSERMYIMELFGAPFWFRGATLFKIAFLDSIIAFIFTVVLIKDFSNSQLFISIIKELFIDYKVNINPILFKLFLISLFISIVSSIIVVIGRKR